MIESELSRREFLGRSILGAGGLLVSFYLPLRVGKAFAEAAGPGPAKGALPANAFIQIAPDNSVTIVINKLEMGQGVNTSMAQLIAEELEADWSKVRSVSCPVDPVYNHTAMPFIMTGGSTALISSWDQYRRLGAGMREMLKNAAADRWKVPASSIKAENGFLHHASKGKLSFGDVAEAAAKLPFPQSPALKKPGTYKLIGKSMPRVDAAAKSNGSAEFGIDVRLPGMLYAVVARPPIPGAKLGQINERAAKKIPNVVDVVRFADRVAVLAKNTHAAKKGRDALAAEWKIAPELQVSSLKLMQELKSKAAGGIQADSRGDADSGLKNAKKVIELEYEFPFLAHAPMEPMNCTIDYNGNQAELWAGFQMPTGDLAAVSAELGLPPEKVTLHTTYAGGSFGRRACKNSDYPVEAAQLAKVVKKPLKIVWTREDDMHGGYYRPMNYHRVKIGLDAKNQLQAWHHEIAGHTVMGGSVMEAMIKNGLEATVTEGVSETRYDLPNFKVLQARVGTPVTTLWWRSVGHTHTAFAMETAIDEIAAASRTDALALRKKLLAKSPRHLTVLSLLEKETGWGKRKAPEGRAWGLAVHESFDTVVGHVAEVSLEDGKPRVHRVWSAVHCGQVVNPEGAKTQVEGAIAFGLSALHQEIRFEGGFPQQQNFQDYPILRINEMPQVTVAFASSVEKPTGLGEPGVPPILPAVANALFKLTGQRLRQLPFRMEKA